MSRCHVGTLSHCDKPSKGVIFGIELLAVKYLDSKHILQLIIQERRDNLEQAESHFWIAIAQATHAVLDMDVPLSFQASRLCRGSEVETSSAMAAILLATLQQRKLVKNNKKIQTTFRSDAIDFEGGRDAG